MGNHARDGGRARRKSLFTLGRQRAFIKVQDGCRYRCAFCIVTIARGEERSRPAREIITEINELHRKNIHEVILTGVHLGGYGSDLESDLTALIQTILAETDVPRIRLGSLEPWELTDEFFSLFDNPRLMPHLHLPLQSGSDTVLRRMARRCKTEEYTGIVERLRRQTPLFNITSDIIAGFPGETDEEWQETLDFVERTGFGHLHIFTYSPRTGTKAAALPGHVPEPIKKQRSRQLHLLAESMRLKFYRKNLGHHFPVLWEGYSEPVGVYKKRIFGYTPNYLKTACVVDNNLGFVNTITPVSLEELGNGLINGRM